MNKHNCHAVSVGLLLNDKHINGNIMVPCYDYEPYMIAYALTNYKTIVIMELIWRYIYTNYSCSTAI